MSSPASPLFSLFSGIAVLLLFFVSDATLAAQTSSETSVTVQNSPTWQKATHSQMLAMSRDPGTEIVDASFYQKRLAAFLVKTPLKSEDRHNAIQEFLAGYLANMNDRGFSTSGDQETQLGPLSGFRYLCRNSQGGSEKIILSYILFSQTDAYLINFFGDVSLTPDHPAVADYLSRVQFSGKMVAGHNSSKTASKTIGQVALAGLIGITLLIFIFSFFAKSRKR